MNKITHAFLVERASAWLAKSGKCSVVITEMANGSGETPDAIGWGSGGKSTLIEVKVSRADFGSDKHKPHRRFPGRGMGNLRYYCAPKGMIAPEELPAGWGLLEWNGEKLVRRVEPSGGYGDSKAGGWEMSGERQEIVLLQSALRRIGQKCPQGVSVRAYTDQSKNNATISVAMEGVES